MKLWNWNNALFEAGSSTFYTLIDELSKRNKFTSEKISSGVVARSAGTTPANNDQIIQFLKGKQLNKYLLTKTHFWLDFAEYNVSQPTFINLIRGEIYIAINPCGLSDQLIVHINMAKNG